MVSPIDAVFHQVTAIDSPYGKSELNPKDTQENIMIQKDDHSSFYGQLIKRYEALFPGSTDDYLLVTCKSKSNYEKNVETYRINVKNNDLVRINKENEMKMPEEELESILASSEKSSNRKTTNKEIKKLFKTTIKNKGYLIKLLSSLPLPLTFAATLVFSLLCAVIASAASIIQYVTYNNLYEDLALQMNIIKVQSESLCDLLAISMTILNGIGYNK